MMKKNRIKRYLAITLCATGLMSWSAEGQIDKLEHENEQLTKQVIQLKKQANTTLSSFFWGLCGGLTSNYKPLIGRTISLGGLAYYHSIYQSVTICIGHVFGHLLAQTYALNSDNKPGKKLTYL